MSSIEINQGEIKISITENDTGDITLASLGLKSEDLVLDGGLLRLTIELGALPHNKFYKNPTVFISYKEEVDETAWQCDYNNETVVEKTDHHGKSTVILINRKKLDELHHRHINTFVLHGEFPEAVHLVPEETYIHFF